MGYCYTKGGALVCDACNGSTNVRKRICPHTVDNLPYCPAPALCDECFDKNGQNAIHADCKAQAEARQREKDAERAELDCGAMIVMTAWGDWDSCVPSGFVGVRFQGSEGKETYRLIRKEDYNPAKRKYLHNYPHARIWQAHH